MQSIIIRNWCCQCMEGITKWKVLSALQNTNLNGDMIHRYVCHAIWHLREWSLYSGTLWYIVNSYRTHIDQIIGIQGLVMACICVAISCGIVFTNHFDDYMFVQWVEVFLRFALFQQPICQLNKHLRLVNPWESLNSMSKTRAPDTHTLTKQPCININWLWSGHWEVIISMSHSRWGWAWKGNYIPRGCN